MSEGGYPLFHFRLRFPLREFSSDVSTPHFSFAPTHYECSTCEYYNDYCRTYYAFEESLDKCAIGTCCDSQPEGNKFVCLPELAPTGTPTLQPTDTFGPTGTPTVREDLLFIFDPCPPLI